MIVPTGACAMAMPASVASNIANNPRHTNKSLEAAIPYSPNPAAAIHRIA